MKHLTITALVAYAVLLGAPRTQGEFAALALKASIFFAQISVMLTPSGEWYDGGFEEPFHPTESA